MLKSVAVFGVALFLSACGNLSQPEIRTLYVAQNTAPCREPVGNVEVSCFLVKNHPEDKWQYELQSVRGFSYEPGFRYKLSINVRAIPNPPADGSSQEWTLRSILEKTADSSIAVAGQ